MKTNKFNQIWSIIWPYLLFIVVITVMIFPQLRAQTMVFGNDTFFHLSRFYDAAEQIRTGKFSWFQTNFAFQQSGRIINAVYGPYFAYLNGLLVLICKNWLVYQVISDYIVCLLAASTMFYLLRSQKISKLIAVVLSAIYMNIGFIPGYLTGMTFTAWGQALMPLVLICGIKMLDKKKWTRFDWLQLAVIMAVMIQIHVISAILSVVVLLPFFVVGLVRKKDKLHFLFSVLKAVVVFLILSVNIFYSLYQVLVKNKIVMPHKYNMVKNGVRLSFYHFNHIGIMGTVINIVLPIFLLLVLAQLIYVLFNLKKNILNDVVTIWAVVLLVISSKLFPWQIVQTTFSGLRSRFQFPSRLVIIAYPLIILGFAITLHALNKNKKTVAFISVLLFVLALETIIPTAYTNYHYHQTHIFSLIVQKQAKISDKALLINNSSFGIPADYLPVRSRLKSKIIKREYKKYVIKKAKKYKHIVLITGEQKIFWHGNKRHKIWVPVVLYKQSQLKVNGKAFQGKKNLIGNPKITQHKGMNEVLLSYKSPKYFNMMLFVNCIFWVVSLGELILCKKKQRK